MQLNLYAATLLFAFTQGVIYTFLLLQRGWQEERKSDFWLAALIAASCIFNLSWMLGFMGIYVLGRELWFFPQDVSLVIGPIIFYYLKTQINTNLRLNRRDLLHFLPYLAYFLHHLIVFSLGKNAVEWWASNVHNPLQIGNFEKYGGIVSAVVYVTLSWRLYRKYLLWLPTERSDTEGVQFEWYHRFLWAIVVGVVAALATFVLGFWVELSYQDLWIQHFIVAVVLYYISVAGYSQVQPKNLIFIEKKVGNDEFKTVESIEIQPSTAPILEETFDVKNPPKMSVLDLENWKIKIQNTMENEKLYLNPELTMSDLADHLNTHNSLISNVINAGFQKNFNDFVNGFRVEIFKEKITHPKLQHLTLLAIAFDCGFNSKSTFNRAVKKATDKMPSEFLVKFEK